jgi:hypothetical protein
VSYSLGVTDGGGEVTARNADLAAIDQTPQLGEKLQLGYRGGYSFIAFSDFSAPKLSR